MPPSRPPAFAERLLERADALPAGARPLDSLAVCRELLTMEPEQVEARLHLAHLLLRLDEREELDPHDAKAHHRLGCVLDRLDRPEDARELYQRSRELAGR